jgi:glycosyltransferase involved in cell wall biosynthesis
MTKNLIVIVPYDETTLKAMLEHKIPDTALGGINHLPDLGWKNFYTRNEIARKTIKNFKDKYIIITIRLTGLINVFINKFKRVKSVCFDYSVYEIDKFKRFKIFTLSQLYDRITVNTLSQLELILNYNMRYKEKFVYFPWAVDTDFWRPSEELEEHYILAVGQASRDYYTFVRATQDIKNRVIICSFGISLRTKIPGENIDLYKLKEMGYKVLSASPQTLRNLYRKALLVVIPLHPTRTGAGVSTFLEACCMKKPCIVTRSPGILDYIEENKNAITIPPYDPKSMRQAIEMLLEDRSLRKNIGQFGYQTVINKYSTKNAASNLNIILSSI